MKRGSSKFGVSWEVALEIFKRFLQKEDRKHNLKPAGTQLLKQSDSFVSVTIDSFRINMIDGREND